MLCNDQIVVSRIEASTELSQASLSFEEETAEFTPGDSVEYNSKSLGWIKATVVRLNPDGTVDLSVKMKVGRDKIRKKVHCPECYGKGTKGWFEDKCGRCKGTGEASKELPNASLSFEQASRELPRASLDEVRLPWTTQRWAACFHSDAWHRQQASLTPRKRALPEATAEPGERRPRSCRPGERTLHVRVCRARTVTLTIGSRARVDELMRRVMQRMGYNPVQAACVAARLRRPNGDLLQHETRVAELADEELTLVIRGKAAVSAAQCGCSVVTVCSECEPLAEAHHSRVHFCEIVEVSAAV